MGKPVILRCRCGKVHKFGEWITPTAGQSRAINSGTYRIDPKLCTDCKVAPGQSNRLHPVRVR